MKRPLSGFTLIEFVIVMTIIAILSAVAFSKYINIQSQARATKAYAIYGTISTAANLAKAMCVLDVSGTSLSPTCTQTGGTVNMDGTAVNMSNLYPAASTTGIIAATQLNTTYDGITVSGSAPLLISINGAPTPANCAVTYTAAALNAAPVITVTVTGC